MKKDYYKPIYHFSASDGWLNDPNGLVYFNGKYHMFYQFHPNCHTGQPDRVQWGHAVSNDMIKWHDLPVALVPGEKYDKDGCWSGTAAVKDGKLYLLYTGFVRTKNGSRQTQCLAWSDDGIHFEKYAKNPVIGSDKIPKYASVQDFRDPDIFLCNGKYYVVVGSHTNRGVPQVLLYSTENLFDYEYCGVMSKRSRAGKMWECPNFVRFGEKQSLIVSPIEYPSDGYKCVNLNSTVYGVGKLDFSDGKFAMGSLRELDAGCDFYATRCIQLDDETPVLVAWAQTWGRKNVTMDNGFGWGGVVTLPRVMSLSNGKIRQKPISAISKYCKNKVKIECNFDGKKQFDGVSGRTVRLKGKVSSHGANYFRIRFFVGDGYYAEFVFDQVNNVCKFDRSASQHAQGGMDNDKNSDNGIRFVEYGGKNGEVSFDLFLDNCIAELFINGGATTATNLVYNPQNADGIVFETDGECTLSFTKYDIVVD